MKNLTPFTKDDRLLILAPHPDDESLATGGLLQRTSQARAATRVVFLTDGDNNPWPQRLTERRWQVATTQDRARWGALRRAEASAALLILLQNPIETEFWSLPDQGLTNLLSSNGGSVLVGKLCQTFVSWQPTHLIIPSLSDRHPDHNALGVASSIALRRMIALGQLNPSLVLSYVVHGRQCSDHGNGLCIVLDETAMNRKRRAILCHRSQVRFSRTRFLSHVRTKETFLKHSDTTKTFESSFIRNIRWDRDALHINLDVNIVHRVLGAPTMHIIAESTEHSLQHICIPVHRRAEFREVCVPLDALGKTARRIFAKLENGLGLYGSSGWVEQTIANP